MKLSSELTAGVSWPMPPDLASMLARLRARAMAPQFTAERERGLGQALRPYMERAGGSLLAPLSQELDLADLYLVADFYPEDGQLSLIEQIRDVVTEHIPEAERAWLDPLKHSSMDLLEVVQEESVSEGMAVTFRSMGDGRRVRMTGGEALRQIPVGEVLLARPIRPPDVTDEDAYVLAGSALRLSAADGVALLERAHEYRRSLEAQSGSFALGEWSDFTKRDGYLLLWVFAEARLEALVDAVSAIQYRSPRGTPVLYALALYDHHQPSWLREGMGDLKGFVLDLPPSADPPAGPVPSESAGSGAGPSNQDHVHSWTFRTPSVVARLTLTPSQLFVECDSGTRLEDLKHQLASAFGYALRFRKESCVPPERRIGEEELAKAASYQVTVPPEEEQRVLEGFLEAAYFDWSDTPSPWLGGETPRHAAARAETRPRVEELIRDMAEHDPIRLRSGRAAFEYKRLRTQIGLSEESA